MKRFDGLMLLAFVAIAATGCGGDGASVESVEAAGAAAVPPASADRAIESAPALADRSLDDPPGGASVAASTTTAAGEGASAAEPDASATPGVAAEAEADVVDESAQQGASAILRRAEVAYDAMRSFDADFVQDLSVPVLESTQRSRGKMFVRRPDRFLMRFTQPAGDVVVADGRYLWLYYPSADKKQVVRMDVGQGGQQVDLQKEFLSDPTARFNAVLNGRESVGGRSAHVLTLTPKAASPYRRVKIWVDAQDALVRRFEITETNESVRRLELTNLRPNAAVADQLFRFTPPAGTQVFSR